SRFAAAGPSSTTAGRSHPGRWTSSSAAAVRIRATGLTQADKNRLSGYGRIDDEGEQMTFANLDPDRVPELVASIVSMGGRVYEVAPRHQTLEDRFLQLLEDEERS